MLSLKITGGETEYPVLLTTESMNDQIAQFYERDRLLELHSYYDPVETGLGIFTVPTPLPAPQPKFGQLFWPVVGAARYAHALFLMDSYSLGKLFVESGLQTEEDGLDSQLEEDGSLQAEEAPSNAVTVVYRDSNPEDVDRVTGGIQQEPPREYPMYLLATRPFVGTGDKAVTSDPEPKLDDAWVVILVDARYYWLEDTGVNQDNGWVPATWDELFSTLAAALWDSPTLTISDAVDADYKTPTSRWTASNLIGLPITHLMDTAAAYVGSRIIYTPAGGLALQRPTASNKQVMTDAHAAMIDASRFMSGGLLDEADLAPGVPANVVAVFFGANGGPPAQTVATTGGGAADRSTVAWLDMKGNESVSARAACARQWGADYFEWQLAPLDAIYAGAPASNDWLETHEAPQSAFLDSVTVFHDSNRFYTRWSRVPIGWSALFRDGAAINTDDTDGGPCEGHGWLDNRDALEYGAENNTPKRVLRYWVNKGETGGLCECVPEQYKDTTSAPFDGPALAFWDGTGTHTWTGQRAIHTCCGCGIVTWSLNDADAPPKITGVLALTDTCDGTAKTYNLKYHCATKDGARFAMSGPKICPAPSGATVCDNVAYIDVMCADCIMDNAGDCAFCKETCSPKSIRVVVTGLSGPRAGYNNTYVIEFDGDCKWTTTCGSITVTLQLSDAGGGDTKATLTLSGLSESVVGENTVVGDLYPCFNDDGFTLPQPSPATAGTAETFPIYCDPCPDKACGKCSVARRTALRSSGIWITFGGSFSPDPNPVHLTYFAGSDDWRATVNFCGMECDVFVRCLSFNDWDLTLQFHSIAGCVITGPFQELFTEVACEPALLLFGAFSAVVSVGAGCECGEQSFDVIATVTETAP